MNTLARFIRVVVILAATCACSGFVRATETVDIGALSPHALVSAGDTARLERVLAKARRGEKITVAVIGGSITQGAKASKPEFRYGERVAAWWRQTFPKTEVHFVNAGIGATGSDYGALRAQRDLLAHQPNFVIAEYAVNDPNLQNSAETLEGLTRQILSQPNQPALLLFFMMHQNGTNAQEWHAKVGAHYQLPMVSLRDALWPEIEKGKLAWTTVEADQVHPNDLGHECAARFVTSFLQQVYAKLPADAALPAVKPVPAPLFTDLFEHVELAEAASLKPARNDGWTLDAKAGAWVSDKPGSVIEFDVNGQLIFFMDFHIRKPMGKAKVQVDDQPALVRDAWFDQTWGGYRATTVIARNLKPGTHHVRVELLEEKNPQSEGHEFRIMGLGSAGVKRN